MLGGSFTATHLPGNLWGLRETSHPMAFSAVTRCCSCCYPGRNGKDTPTTDADTPIEDASMTMVRTLVCVVALLAASGKPVRADQPGQKDLPAHVSYFKHILPIFQLHCQGCHQPAKPQGDYIMTDHASLLKAGEKEQPGVVPGQPDKSMVIQELLPRDGKPPAMPKGKDPLTDHQVALIKKWITQGAKDDTPASARIVIDSDHPPAYTQPPAITGLDFSPDGNLLAVTGYHEILL